MASASASSSNDSSLSSSISYGSTDGTAARTKSMAAGGDGKNMEDTPLLGSSAKADDSSEWAGYREYEGLPWWKRPSVYWLLPVFLIFTLAWGGMLVPRLNLILNLICADYLTEQAGRDPNFTHLPVIFDAENPQCRTKEVQARVATFTLYTSLLSGLFAAITSPKLGALSDRYGRLRIIACTNFGMVMAELITLMAAKYPDTVSVNWMLLGSTLDGLSGSFTAAMAITHAYASDCTAPARRNVAFGYFHGCLFTGIAFGPLMAAYIIRASGQIITIFYVALGAHLFFLFCLLFIIPESLSKARRQAAREKHEVAVEHAAHVASGDLSPQWHRAAFGILSSGHGLFAPLRILRPTGAGSSAALRRNLVSLAAVDTIMFGVAMGSMTVVVYYSEYCFGWGTFEASRFMSIISICRVSCLLLVLPILTRLLRGRKPTSNTRAGCDNFDIGVIRTAILFDVIGYIGYALSTSGSMLIASGVVAAVGGVGSPTLQSSLTRHVSPERTGQLLGAMGLLHALARVVAPTVFNLIYVTSVRLGFPSTVFYCLAATFLLALGLSFFIRPHVYYDEAAAEDIPQPAAPVAAAAEDDELLLT